MKTLLRKTLRATRDEAVYQALVGGGFPSTYYTFNDVAWDLGLLVMRANRGASDPTYGLPIEIFNQYNIEIAKDSIRRGKGRDVITYVGKNLLTRVLTEEEQAEIIRAVSYNDKPHREGLLNVLHAAFKTR